MGLSTGGLYEPIERNAWIIGDLGGSIRMVA
jgi:hypothetical protein